MKWYFFNTGENTGKFNMDFDISLAEKSASGNAYFRLFRWKPYCISLGANQNPGSINKLKADEEKIDIVVRPTGGRAILHAEELTYSVVLPINAGSSVRNIYNDINKALVEGLKIYSNKLSDFEMEKIQPDFQKYYKEEISSVCFAVSAKSEVKYAGKKLIGSAQRKLNTSVLQHGSILCGSYHKNIIKYLKISPEKYSILADEISNKTIDLKSILEEEINYEKLSDALVTGFKKYFQISFEKNTLEYSENFV